MSTDCFLSLWGFPPPFFRDPMTHWVKAKVTYMQWSRKKFDTRETKFATRGRGGKYRDAVNNPVGLLHRILYSCPCHALFTWSLTDTITIKHWWPTFLNNKLQQALTGDFTYLRKIYNKICFIKSFLGREGWRRRICQYWGRQGPPGPVFSCAPAYKSLNKTPCLQCRRHFCKMVTILQICSNCTKVYEG